MAGPAHGRNHSHTHTPSLHLIQAGWEDVAYQLRSALPHARFILPTAPTRPISLNGGYPMPGWYDIHSLGSLQGRADGPGVAASTDYISGLMDSLAAGIPSDRVVMAGFSQGGAMALAMLGRVPGKVCGVCGAREGRVRAGWGRARARRAPFATLHPPSPSHHISLYLSSSFSPLFSFPCSRSSPASSPCPATCP
jgi:pimeloyl-ACP methyl ester carboxylesterase